jgi:23S rRNA pseudouridine1911/1915/1917 synthase
MFAGNGAIFVPMADLITLIADATERLDRFLARRLPRHSRARLAAHIQKGQVRVEGRVERPAFRLKPGMEVRVEPITDAPAHDLTPAPIPLDVRYEDEHLLAVNKPRGLATHPAPTLREPSLVNALLARGQELSSGSSPYRPGIVHRLDKDTTGLLVVAKSDAVHAALARQFERKTARRIYLAVVAGRLDQDRVVIDAPIGRDPRNRKRMAVLREGKPAVTHIRKLGALAEGTLLAAELETGRTHQVRVHLAFAKLPVLGDTLYAPRSDRSLPLQLHAALLEFDHPATGERLRVFAEPPEDFLLLPANVADGLVEALAG